MAKKTKIYAVAIGQTSDGEMVYGKTYSTWPECEAVTAGVPGAIYKSFENGLEAASWLFTVLKANGISNDEVEYSLQALKTSAKATVKSSASPVKLMIPEPYSPPEISSLIELEKTSNNDTIPVSEVQVTPLLQWQPEPLPESLGGNAVDIQFDIVCYRFGLKPNEVMNHLKRQFLETFGTMEKSKG